jgi:hypothetical protein
VLFLDVSELDADPGVGLRIPTNKQWPQSDDFRSELFDLLPHELRRMKWPELEWPLWRFIPISSTGETPDIAAFMDQTAEVVKAIAGLRPDIDRLLSSNR